jgi:hypothetical protein
MLLAAWLCIPAFFWVTFCLLTKNRPTRHVGFLHYVIYFFSIYLGSLTIYHDEGMANHWYLASVMMYPVLSLLGILSGALIAPRACIPSTRTNRRVRRDIRLVVVTVGLFLLVYAAYLYMFGAHIPLLVMLNSGDPVAGRLARYVATKGYSEVVGGLGSLVWFPRILIDYFAEFVIVFAYVHLKMRRLSNAAFGLLLGGLLVLSVVDTQKYPAIKLLVVLAVCAYNWRNPRIGLRSIVSAAKVAGVAILTLGIIYAVVSGQSSRLYEGGVSGGMASATEFGWEMMTTRGIVGQSIPLYRTYELIPSTHDFFMGRTLANPRGLLPYRAVPLPYFIGDSYGPEEEGVRRGAPTVFFGEVYANFGIAISWLSMVVAGCVLQIVNSRLSEKVDRAQSPFYLAYFYLVMTYVADFAISFSTPYFDERLWFLVAFYIIRRLRVGDARETRTKEGGRLMRKCVSVSHMG